jgi:conjugative transfer signal peptidase TraF
MTHTNIAKALRLYALAASAILLATIAGAAIPMSGHELVFNDSPSVPRGLYWIRLGAEPRERGEYVVFLPPDTAATLIYGRGWLPRSMPLLKPLGGVEGDSYCVAGGRFIVNDIDAGPVYFLDAQGLPLPQMRGCRRVGHREFLPLSTYLDRSFDGRYMGAVSMSKVLGSGRPLLTF